MYYMGKYRYDYYRDHEMEYDDEFDPFDEDNDWEDDFGGYRSRRHEDYEPKEDLLHKKKFSSFENEFFMKCPLCNSLIQNSLYLANNFEHKPFAYWSACLVTHYRHNHINYYDASWKNPYYADKNREYTAMSHDNYRTLVNNRAKRQLMRGIVKNTTFDIETKKHLIEGFKELQYNDEKTNTLLEKKLLLLSGKKTKKKKAKKKRS